MTPNSIYNNTSITGGIRLSNPEIIKIFYDIEKDVLVSRSMFTLPKKLTKTDFEKIYTLDDPEIAVKLNKTRVRVRALFRDLSKVYLYDIDTDKFITTVQETIRPYGDIDSMKDEGHEKYVMGHAQKLKAFKNYLNAKSAVNNDQIAKLIAEEEKMLNLNEIL